jgi:tetratricopeptide (TPR) repeat protein
MREQHTVLAVSFALCLAIGCGRGERPAADGPLPVETEAADPRERELRAAIRERPEDGEARRALGVHLLRARRPYGAMWAFQDALELSAEDGDARRGIARALIVAQLPERALAELAAGAAPGTAALEDRRVAAAAYLARGDPEGAVTMLEVVGTALDASAAGLLDLAHAYEALGETVLAERAYQRHLRADPKSLDGQLGLARVAVQEGHWETAFAALDQARRIAPDEPRPLFHLARALQARGGDAADSERPGGAIAIYRHILSAHPGYGPAHLQLGRWHKTRGRPEAAAREIEQALRDRAVGEEIRLELADALEAAGDRAAAAYHRGLAYEKTGRLHLAVREYRRLATLDPGRKDVPLLLSAAYSQMEQDEAATAATRQGLERAPEELPVRARHAMLLMMTDERAQAAELCAGWVRERPEWAEPYRLLARLERESLQYADAVRHMEQAIEREPRNPEYHLELARSLIGIGTPDALKRAARVLREGLALAPDHPEIHLRLGETLERLDDLEGARDHYLRSMDEARNVHYGAYSLSRLCPRLKKAGRARFYAENVRVIREREDSAQALWRQIHRAPGDAGLRVRLADLLLRSGDTREALYHLEFALSRGADAHLKRQVEILRRLHAMRDG